MTANKIVWLCFYKLGQYINLEKQSIQVSQLTEKRKNHNGYNDFNGENVRMNSVFLFNFLCWEISVLLLSSADFFQN